MARRDEEEYPSWIFDRGATKPDGLWRENPPGGGSFARRLRWFVPYSPLRGCSELAALPAAKIPRRSAPRNFQPGSKEGASQNGAVTDEQRCGRPKDPPFRFILSPFPCLPSYCFVNAAGVFMRWLLHLRLHIPRQFYQFEILRQVAETEMRHSTLLPSQQLTRPAQFQVRFRDAKTVRRFLQHPEPPP